MLFRSDVVFPVAPASDKAGTYVTWEGRPRPFERVLANPASLPELRALSGIADELAALGHGRGLGFRTVEEARAEMTQLGPWDGVRPALEPVPVSGGAPAPGSGLALATWKQLIDNGSMQDGDKYLAATARPAVAKVSPTVLAALGETVVVTGDRGSLTLPAEAADLPDDVVWVPANSVGEGVLAALASPGSRVTVKGVEQ